MPAIRIASPNMWFVRRHFQKLPSTKTHSLAQETPGPISQQLRNLPQHGQAARIPQG